MFQGQFAVHGVIDSPRMRLPDTSPGMNTRQVPFPGGSETDDQQL